MTRTTVFRAGIACLLALATACFPAGRAGAEGFILGETKEGLKLDYEITATNHTTGRVTIVLMIADEGRLRPLDSVELYVPNRDGTNYADLSVALAMRDVDGKKQVVVHGLKDLVTRAELHLSSRRLDGKEEELTFYVHSIPLAPYFKGAQPKPE